MYFIRRLDKCNDWATVVSVLQQTIQIGRKAPKKVSFNYLPGFPLECLRQRICKISEFLYANQTMDMEIRLEIYKKPFKEYFYIQ